MNKNFYKKQALKRVTFTFSMVLIYLLGSNIVIPGVNTLIFQNTLNGSPSLAFALGVSGLSLQKFSLFSIGLGPWMSALILWRMFALMKKFKLETLTEAQSFRFKFIFSLILGIIQSLAILAQMSILSGERQPPKVFLVFILITGLAIIIWLGNMNSQYGFGGSTIFILVAMIRDWPNKIISKLQQIHPIPSEIIKFVGIIFIIIFLLFLIFRFYQGERRLSIMHVMLDGEYAAQSYLPIPTNPAGGMPFMYAFSVMLFPQYLFFLLGGDKSNYKVVTIIYKQLQIDHIPGVLLLSLTIAILTYGFSYANIDYKMISEGLKKSGDYFENVYPGKNTEKYLFYKISQMATLAALFNCSIIGVPMILSLFIRSISTWVLLLPTLIILMVLIQEIYVQFQQAYNRNNYNKFLK